MQLRWRLPLDLVLATRADGDKQVEVTLTQGGTCHGWLGWFQMRLLDEWLSTAGEPDSTHWGPVFMPVENPLSVRAGEPVGFALKRPELGEWAWTTEHAGQRQRQSTFLSQTPRLRECLRLPIITNLSSMRAAQRRSGCWRV